MFKPALLLVFTLIFTGCSSTKEDKSLAFYAIFRTPLKAEMTVNHAKIWENRHLFVFYEYYALVEFEATDEEMTALLKNTGETFEPFDATDYGFGLQPDDHWFAPRDGAKYHGWRSQNNTTYVIRSSKTGHIFAYRSEL